MTKQNAVIFGLGASLAVVLILLLWTISERRHYREAFESASIARGVLDARLDELEENMEEARGKIDQARSSLLDPEPSSLILVWRPYDFDECLNHLESRKAEVDRLRTSNSEALDLLREARSSLDRPTNF